MRIMKIVVSVHIFADLRLGKKVLDARPEAPRIQGDFQASRGVGRRSYRPKINLVQLTMTYLGSGKMEPVGRRRAAPRHYGRSGVIERLPVPGVWSIGLVSVVFWHWAWSGFGSDPPQKMSRPIDHGVQEPLCSAQLPCSQLPK